MIYPWPLLARIRRKLGGGAITNAAEERIELSPPLLSDRPAAVSLPGEFDRAISFYETREMEQLRVAGGPRREGATVAYRVRNVFLAEGALYKNGAGQFYRGDAPRFFVAGAAERRADGLLATSLMGERYFGDWLIESPSLALIAERLQVPSVAFAREPYLHALGYQALLGVSPEPLKSARFDRLWIVDDRGMNAYRAERFKELRQRLRASVGRGGPTHVLLARGNLGQAREVTNSAAMEAMLIARGYTVIHPEREKADTLASKLASARAIVTVEGSAQLHALMAMPDSATLVILQPPLRFTAPGKDIADLAGLRYGYLVGEPDEGGFRVDLHRLGTLLDLVA